MSENYAISLKRSTALLAALTFMAMLTVVNFASFFSNKAGAAQLQNRSVVLASTLAGSVTTGAANSETNGGNTTHTFTFDTPSTTSLQQIDFLYCTTAIGVCTPPTSLAVGTPTIATQTTDGNAWSNAWTTGSSSANRITISNTGAAPAVANDTAVFAFSGLRNPDTVGTFFVRIRTYSDAGSTLVDDGTVAAAITTGIQITTRVAETLGFSVTGEVDDTHVGDPTAVGTCDPVTGSGAIQIGDPAYEYTLDINSAYDAWSAFRLYTNASNGVVVQYEGELLTRSGGGADIDSIGTGQASQPGTEQFGLAIAENANGDAGSGDFLYVDGSADWQNTNGYLDTAANYGGGDGTITSGGTALFSYAAGTPTTIAVGGSYVDCATGAVRYIANVSPLTPSGVYTTTIVYSAVPTY